MCQEILRKMLRKSYPAVCSLWIHTRAKCFHKISWRYDAHGYDNSSACNCHIHLPHLGICENDDNRALAGRNRLQVRHANYRSIGNYTLSLNEIPSTWQILIPLIQIYHWYYTSQSISASTKSLDLKDHYITRQGECGVASSFTKRIGLMMGCQYNVWLDILYSCRP